MLTVFYCTDRIVLHLDAEVPKEEQPDPYTVAKNLGITNAVRLLVLDSESLSANEQRELYDFFSSRSGDKLMRILHQAIRPLFTK